MLEVAELRAFHCAALHLNFARAASETGLSAPQFSKVIANLEAKLKTRLFQRSTRKVILTAEGTAFLEAARSALEALNLANDFFDHSKNSEDIRGTIRITAPSTLGTRFLSVPLTRLHQQFPKVEVQVLLADQYLDFITNEIDLALRVMRPEDSNLIAKKVSDNPVALFASPRYLTENKPIKNIKDLGQHTVYAITSHHSLVFSKSKTKLIDLIQSTPVVCSNGDLLVELAKNGSGIVVRSEWGVERELKTGQLVRVDLDDTLISNSGVYLVYPKNRFQTQRTKAFVKILTSFFNEKK